MADEIAERLAKMLPPQLQAGGGQPQIPPQVQQMIQQGGQQIQQLSRRTSSSRRRPRPTRRPTLSRPANWTSRSRSFGSRASKRRRKRIQAEQPTFVRAPSQSPASQPGLA
jgi:hypothetical protein